MRPVNYREVPQPSKRSSYSVRAFEARPALVIVLSKQGGVEIGRVGVEVSGAMDEADRGSASSAR